MDTFYQTVASFCFTLLGLWWGVTQLRHAEWMANAPMRRMAHSIYFSFLIPGAMSLAAQVSGDARWVWQIVFAVAGLGGAVATGIFMRLSPGNGLFHRFRFVIALLYLLIAVFAWFPEMAAPLTLKPLQVEGLLLSLLVFLGAGLAWEFLTDLKQSQT